MDTKPKVYKQGPHDWVADFGFIRVYDHGPFTGAHYAYHAPTWRMALDYALELMERSPHIEPCS